MMTLRLSELLFLRGLPRPEPGSGQVIGCFGLVIRKGFVLNQKKASKFLIPLVLLAAVIGLRILFSEKVDDFSMRVFDQYQKIKPRVYKDAPVRFVDIDDESLARIGQWPWPRTVLAQLVSKLSEKGAAVIVMDILFSEADRTSPASALPVWTSDLPELKALQSKVTSLPDHDQVFAKAISEARVVTGFNLNADKNSNAPLVKAGFAHSGEDPLAYLPVFRGSISNLAILEKETAGNGSFNFIADSDAVLRRVPLVFRYENQLVPSLVAEAVRVAQGASSYVIKSSGGSGKSSFGENTGITDFKIGQFVVPTDREGRIWLYDTGKEKKRYLSAAKILSSDFDSKLVEGSIVFLGSSAAGLKDLRATPLSSVSAGTEVHVQLVEQILNQDFLSRPDFAPGLEIVFILALGLLLIFLLPLMGAVLAAVLSVASIMFEFLFSWHAFSANHQLFDPVTPSVAVLVIYLAVSLMHFLRTESEKNQIRGAFGQYVSPQLLEKISKNPEQLKLGGETRAMTILFSDIRNFTTLSEKMSAEDLTQFMNRYLTPMTNIIMSSSGTIDKYIGDCIMAFWNAPVTDQDHVAHACQAALEMQSYLKSWNAMMQSESKANGKYFQPIKIGIGLNTGDCCVGNMGSDQRFDYSVLGDDVNLASRLEGQSKFYGVDIILGPNTQAQAFNFATLEMDVIRVKGKIKPVQIYALIGGVTLKKNPQFQELELLHQKMILAYRAQQWSESEKLIDLLLEKGGGFGLENLYQLYQKSIQTYKADPANAAWDCVNSLSR